MKPPAAITKLIEEGKAALEAQDKGEKRSLSMVVVGMFLVLVIAVMRSLISMLGGRPCRCRQVHNDGETVVRTWQSG